MVYSKSATTEGEYQKLPTVEMSSRQNEKAKQTFRLGAQMGGGRARRAWPLPLVFRVSDGARIPCEGIFHSIGLLGHE